MILREAVTFQRGVRCEEWAWRGVKEAPMEFGLLLALSCAECAPGGEGWEIRKEPNSMPYRSRQVPWMVSTLPVNSDVPILQFTTSLSCVTDSTLDYTFRVTALIYRLFEPSRSIKRHHLPLRVFRGHQTPRPLDFRNREFVWDIQNLGRNRIWYPPSRRLSRRHRCDIRLQRQCSSLNTHRNACSAAQSSITIFRSGGRICCESIEPRYSILTNDGGSSRDWVL